MSLVVITPPVALAVSVAEAKVHLREDGADQDTLIESLIKAATANIDGPAGWLGRALITQTLEMRVKGFLGSHLPLRCPPIIAVVSMKYDDAAGVEQTADPALYRLVGHPNAPVLTLAHGQSWPATRWQAEAVRIRYTAGYGASGVDVPAPIRAAILLIVAHLYNNREAVTVGQSSPSVLPMAVDHLLLPYRVWS